MKKILNALGLAVDLARPVLMVLAGIGLIVGGTTGTLWY